MPTTQPSRLLNWDACYNARDLGGYETADGGQTRWGAFVRADNLVRLTPAGRRALVDYGIRTIVDLRRRNELVLDPNPFASSTDGDAGVTYLNLPFGKGATNAAIAAVHTAQSPLVLYPLALEHYQTGIARTIGAIATATEGGVLFHCHAGKDRTGIVAALLLSLANVPRDTIIADYVISAEALRPHDEALLSTDQDPEALRQNLAQWDAKAETMQVMLDYLDQEHGGVEHYLLDAGLEPTALTLIQRRFRG